MNIANNQIIMSLTSCKIRKTISGVFVFGGVLVFIAALIMILVTILNDAQKLSDPKALAWILVYVSVSSYILGSLIYNKRIDSC